MGMNHSRVLRFAFLWIALLPVSQVAPAQVKRALLIGINTYSPETKDASGNTEPSTRLVTTGDTQAHPVDSRFSGMVVWYNLDGPENDVENMAAVLPQFGFSQINQLTGQNATRAAILAAIDKYIIAEPNAGDTVLFYFAGHGSQRYNSKSSKADHLDETIVPADAYKGAFDIRDKELARKFNQAIDKGIHVIAIFDSCHSGTMARGAKVGVARWLPYDDRDASDGGDYGTPPAHQTEPPARRGAVIVSAALSTQSADEVSEENGSTAHGVFTNAFIRVLRSSTPAWTALDLVNATDGLLKADGWTQQVTVEGPVNRPLFGDFTVTGIRATVRALTPSGQVTLNAGSAMGFGPGSEFESKSGTRTHLEVVEITGPASSRAKITSGTLENIHPGDLFEITRLAVPFEAKLSVFVPGIASPDEPGSIQGQVSKLQSSGKWTLVNDPILELPSNLVYWTTAGWVMTTPQGSSINLGATLTTGAISKGVQNGAKVYVSIPPSQSLIDALKQQLGISTGVLDLSNSLAASQYILTGRLSREQGGNAEYALVLARVFGALDPATMVQSQNAEGKTFSCSTDSELPLRTDWVLVGAEHESIAAAANAIETAALKLGRSRSWLVAEARNNNSYWPYRLVTMQANGDLPLSNTPLAAGTKYDINLVADPAKLRSQPVTPQYVYLFGLQCDGAGVLLYPSAELGGGAPLPLLSPDHHYPNKINLVTLEVAPPFGLDTIILLVTPDRIADLSAFNYSGVITRGKGTGGAGGSGELEELVRDIGGGSRGSVSVSATWSIQRASVNSR
jgi:uncharacterized caspase-like protein